MKSNIVSNFLSIINSRTVQLSVITIILGALQAAQTLELSSTTMGYVTGAIGFLGLIIRFLTNKPLINTFRG